MLITTVAVVIVRSWNQKLFPKMYRSTSLKKRRPSDHESEASPTNKITVSSSGGCCTESTSTSPRVQNVVLNGWVFGNARFIAWGRGRHVGVRGVGCMAIFLLIGSTRVGLGVLWYENASKRGCYWMGYKRVSLSHILAVSLSNGKAGRESGP